MRKLSKTLALIGFPASGKTTLGKTLAHHLDCSFIDTDQLIEQHFHLSCRDLYQWRGRAHFRQLEKQVIASLTYDPPLVIATGGGSLLLAANQKILKMHAHLLYLKTSAEALQKRIWERKELPAYLQCADPHQAFKTLYEERMGLYQAWADQILEMDGLSEQQALKKALDLVSCLQV